MSKLMIIIGEDEIVGKWVGDKIGNKVPFHAYTTVGIAREGELIGGAVIDNYILNARCSVHCAGEGTNWLNRDFLTIVFHHIFKTLKCNAVINVVRGTNTASLRFTKHIGFTEFHRTPGGSIDGSDAVWFQMLKDECRWYKEKEEK